MASSSRKSPPPLPFYTSIVVRWYWHFTFLWTYQPVPEVLPEAFLWRVTVLNSQQHQQLYGIGLRRRRDGQTCQHGKQLLLTFWHPIQRCHQPQTAAWQCQKVPTLLCRRKWAWILARIIASWGAKGCEKYNTSKGAAAAGKVPGKKKHNPRSTGHPETSPPLFSSQQTTTPRASVNFRRKVLPLRDFCDFSSRGRNKKKKCQLCNLLWCYHCAEPWYTAASYLDTCYDAMHSRCTSMCVTWMLQPLQCPPQWVGK